MTKKFTKRRITPAGRKRIAAAQRARWALSRRRADNAAKQRNEMIPLPLFPTPPVKVTLEIPYQTFKQLLS